MPDQVMEGDQVWVLQGCFHVPHFVDLLSAGQKTFTVLFLHLTNICAKKRGNTKKLILTIRAIMILISMGLRGDAAIETVPLMKPLRTALCQRIVGALIDARQLG